VKQAAAPAPSPAQMARVMRSSSAANASELTACR